MKHLAGPRVDRGWWAQGIRAFAIGVLGVAIGCGAAPSAPSDRASSVPSVVSEPAGVGSGGVDSTAASSATGSTDSSVVAALPKKEPVPSRLLVHVVPLGDVSPEILATLKRGMEGHAELRIDIAPAVSLSQTRRAKRPGRYLAASMLETLAALPGTSEGKVLGVTAVDIVAEKDGNPEWGVLGLGSLDGKACVLSTFRMKRAWERGGATDELVAERLWKTAVHEVGHTLGLEHCATKGCLMEDGQGTVATTDAETALCPTCAERYRRASAR